MKNIFITGANRGLGKAIADTFQLYGHNTFRHGRTKGDITGDLTSQAIIDKIEYSMPIINPDIFINNAAVKPLEDSLLLGNSFTNTFATNIYAHTKLIQIVYKHFVKKGKGLIVNINSMFCKNPNGSEPIYGASKMAIRGLLQALSIESQGTNVNILDVFLGATHTDMTKEQDRPMISCLEAAKVITDIALINTDTCYINEVVIRSNTA